MILRRKSTVRRHSATALLALLMTAGGTALADATTEVEIFGHIETVSLGNEAFELDAKLDTGADNSSLHAPEIERFERDGEDWVRFTVENNDGDRREFERRKERTARIIRASGDIDERPVIKLGLCLGTVYRDVEVNLNDRSELSYPVLIGRSFLRDHILVDSGPKYTTEPDCASASANG